MKRVHKELLVRIGDGPKKAFFDEGMTFLQKEGYLDDSCSLRSFCKLTKKGRATYELAKKKMPKPKR